MVGSADHQISKYLPSSEDSEKKSEMYNHLTTDASIRDIVDHPAFEGFGALLFFRAPQARPFFVVAI